MTNPLLQRLIEHGSYELSYRPELRVLGHWVRERQEKAYRNVQGVFGILDGLIKPGLRP